MQFHNLCYIWFVSYIQENIVEITTSVPVKYHKHFVARRGAVLRELADEYGGVTVSFPRQGQDSEEVKIKGAKDCVVAAENRIKEIVDDLVCFSLAWCCGDVDNDFPLRKTK